MDLFIIQLVSGIAVGAIYACMALAIVMIYEATGHINFAQGEMAMFSTFTAWQLMQWGVPYWGSFLIAVALSLVAGIIIEKGVFRRLGGASHMAQITGYIALLTIFNSAAGLIWDFTLKPFPSPFGSASMLGGIISSHQAGMIAVTLGLLALLYVFFRYTSFGLAMRAAAKAPDSARLVGIKVGWMVAFGWGLGAAIGAVAGILIAPVVFLDPNMMFGVLLFGFASAVLGGLSNPAGAVAGGLIVGVIENLVGTYVPGMGHELKLPIALALIVAALVLRPNGLFGRAQVHRV